MPLELIDGQVCPHSQHRLVGACGSGGQASILIFLQATYGSQGNLIIYLSGEACVSVVKVPELALRN